MATTGGRPDPSLEQTLLEEGYRFNFFQAIRLLERVFPDREPIGHDAHPTREVVRIQSLPSLNFPPSAVCEIRPGKVPSDSQRMIIAFMGLIGPQGVLPRHYTEIVMERIRYKDRTLQDFLDIFLHRMGSFFYRAWEKHHVPVLYERRGKSGGRQDPFTEGLLALVGMGTMGLGQALPLSKGFLLGYAGMLSQRPRSAGTVKQVLEGYFGLPILMKQFEGEWLPLAEEDCTRLVSRGRNNVLGLTAIAGTHVWDQQANIHLNIGPLSQRRFKELLPSGHTYPALVAMTRFLVGQGVNFFIRLLLKAEEVPGCYLSEQSSYAPLLGWTTWLSTEPREKDADDVVFSGNWKWDRAGPLVSGMA